MPQEALILAATPWNNSAPGNLSDEAGISNPFPRFHPLQGKTISRRPLQPVPRLIEIAIALFMADGIPALSNGIFRPSWGITFSLAEIYIHIHIYIYKYYDVYRL